MITNKLSLQRNDKVLAGLVIVGCIIMAFVDTVVAKSYMTKSICKIIVFSSLPYIYFSKNKNLSDFKLLFKINKKNLVKSLLMGAGVYAFILLSFFTIGKFFDFSSVTKSLNSNIGVNSNNFIFVALYISFINSLLEEMFFRGFAFITLKNITTKKFAYIFSALCFSIYHVCMMIGWFDIFLFLLLILALFMAGVFFNFLDDKNNNIYNSWIVHMFANFAINTIGFILFGIITL